MNGGTAGTNAPRSTAAGARCELGDRHLRAVLAVEREVAAEDLRERLRLPRERVALRVLAHGSAAVGRDRRAVRVDDDERRDALDLVALAERALARAVAVRQREPRHLAEVRVERALVAVRAHEHDLEVEALRLVRFVVLREPRREAAARRAPVRAEVDADDFARERIGGLDGLATLRDELRAEEVRRRGHCRDLMSGERSLVVPGETRQVGGENSPVPGGRCALRARTYAPCGEEDGSRDGARCAQSTSAKSRTCAPAGVPSTAAACSAPARTHARQTGPSGPRDRARTPNSVCRSIERPNRGPKRERRPTRPAVPTMAHR